MQQKTLHLKPHYVYHCIRPYLNYTLRVTFVNLLTLQVVTFYGQHGYSAKKNIEKKDTEQKTETDPPKSPPESVESVIHPHRFQNLMRQINLNPLQNQLTHMVHPHRL